MGDSDDEEEQDDDDDEDDDDDDEDDEDEDEDDDDDDEEDDEDDDDNEETADHQQPGAFSRNTRSSERSRIVISAPSLPSVPEPEEENDIITDAAQHQDAANLVEPNSHAPLSQTDEVLGNHLSEVRS
jgi:hypothetical protein